MAPCRDCATETLLYPDIQIQLAYDLRHAQTHEDELKIQTKAHDPS